LNCKPENRDTHRRDCSQIELLKKIAEYIEDETNDSIFYYEMAKLTPMPQAQALLVSFAQDEADHAANFKTLYRLITGTSPPEIEIKQPKINSFEEAVRQRIIAESGDFQKYALDYTIYHEPPICDLFYLTSIEEGQHAMRLTLLLEN